jgi:glyoxylase-like metal-dependent hydrolase (beta-lactamase superfamily II)
MQDGSFDPVPGRAEVLEPGVRRVLAPNPSPMTFRGTNTYILGTGAVAVIDPGPLSDPHMAAILAALAPGETISHIFVTHSHLDHSPLARPLSRVTGAPVLGYGPSSSGRSAIMTSLAATTTLGGGEGTDPDFAPDILLADGAEVTGQSWAMQAIHTPGHFGNHLSYAWNELCFTGDHVMGWASSLVSPPEGDMGAYMASLARLAAQPWRVFHPGHGAPIHAPATRLAFLADHRRKREADILTALGHGPGDIPALTCRIYDDLAPGLLRAAERNVFAHLVDLAERNKVIALPQLAFSAVFSRAAI